VPRENFTAQLMLPRAALLASFPADRIANPKRRIMRTWSHFRCRYVF